MTLAAGALALVAPLGAQAFTFADAMVAFVVSLFVPFWGTAL